MLMLALLTAVAAHAPAREAAVPAATFQLATDTVVIPMRFEDGRISVDVRINGHGPYPFILDTGAHGGVFDQELATELKIRLGEPSRVSSPDGAGLTAHMVKLDRVEIGGLTVRGMRSAVIEKLPFPKSATTPRGVLSPYHLPGLLVTLDYPNQELRFRRGALPEPDGREVFGWDPAKGLPEIPISIAGHDLLAHLDSGAQSGLTLPDSLAALVPLDGPVTELGRARLVDRELKVRLGKLAGDVRIGRYTLERPQLHFSDISRKHINVGPAILRQLALTLDSGNSRLQIEGPASGRLEIIEQRPKRYGMRFLAFDANPLEVAAVDTASVAAQAGVATGDRILEINGKPVETMDADQRMQALRSPAIQLVVQRGEKRLDLSMSLETASPAPSAGR